MVNDGTKLKLMHHQWTKTVMLLIIFFDIASYKTIFAKSSVSFSIILILIVI